MHLDLVSSGDYRSVLEEDLEVLDRKVGDSYRPHFAFYFSLLAFFFLKKKILGVLCDYYLYREASPCPPTRPRNSGAR